MQKNNAIKALIIDDEMNSRMLLNSMMERYCQQVQVVGLADSAKIAQEMIQKQQPDLLLLDIEMPRGSGFELLKWFSEPSFEIIFVTGFDHYALQAIKVHALDYLLKPVDIDELIEAVKKVEKRRHEREKVQNYQQLLAQLQSPVKPIEHITIPTTSGKEFIPIQQIMYCQADGPCTWIYLEHRRLYSSKNLGEYEKLLPAPDDTLNHRFYRIHHRYLLNFYFVKKYIRQESQLELLNGQKIPIAQRRKSQFLQYLKTRRLG